MSRLPAAPDQVIRDAIVGDIDASCFVEASAGTGKTSLLVARILSLLRRPEVRAERLVAITFTEKAAAELMGRVRDALQRAVGDPASPGHATLVRALEELDRAAITTIHSFCTRLLREIPVEAGVSPGFKVIDELEAGRLFDATWEAWLADIEFACAWLVERTAAPLWLWGQRTDCLLATEAANRMTRPVDLLF